jgi:outer membrane protein, heavy metal efflux system
MSHRPRLLSIFFIGTVALAPAPAVVAQVSIVAPQQSPAADAPLTLEAAFARALASNPLIAAARLRRAIDLAGIDVAAERPNPDVHLEVEKEAPKQSFGLALPFELGGKRSRRIAVAEATVKTGDAELTQTIIDVRGQIRRAYFNRLIAETRRTIVQELREFAARARAAAQQRFDVGSAPRLELLQAQLALADSENDVSGAQAAVQAAGVQLNALLGLPLDSSVPLATTLDAAPALIGATAVARAASANSEVALVDTQIAEAQARVALARTLRVPDIAPDVTVTHGAEPEFLWGWRVAASATIPLFTTHRAALREEEATLVQLNAQRAAVVARVTGDVTAASVLAEAERLTFLRYRDDILPQVQEVERMAEDSYRLGQTGIAALLQALQSSRQLRLQSLQAASDFQNALSDLERAIGAPIP